MSPIKESEIEERIANMVEWATENQGLIKDGWKILKVYKTISGSYTKYALIECIHCGNKKLVIYYNFMKKKILCHVHHVAVNGQIGQNL